MPENSGFFPEIIAVLCTLKVIEPGLYQAARTGTLSFDQLALDTEKVRRQVADDPRFFGPMDPNNVVGYCCDMIDCFSFPDI
jgi:hypothetical protein